MIAGEVDAGLVLLKVVGLSRVPVGVGHRRQRLVARTCRRHSPDERRLATRIYALSGRPEVDALYGVSCASVERRL